MQQSQVYWSANVNKLFTVDSTADFAFQTLWPQPLAGGVADSMKTRYPHVCYYNNFPYSRSNRFTYQHLR